MSGEINWIIFATSLALLVAALLVLIRALLGPTLYDRILAVNAMGTKTVIFLVLLGFMGPHRTGFLDIALLYALVNYLATIAMLKFVVKKQLG